MKIKSIFLLTLFLLFLHTAYSQSQTENYKLYNNVSYISKKTAANDTLQSLNLVVPKTNGNIPLLIWIGGGAWSYVNKNVEMDLAKKIANKGIAVASVGHRLSPAVWRDATLNKGIQHPKHIEDIAAAVKWLHTHAETYGYNKEQFFIGGFSSGGHLAALLYLNQKYLKKEGLSSKIIKGIIPISGTYDVANYRNAFATGNRPDLAELHVDAVFGKDTVAVADASPINYLNNLDAPMLIISDGNVVNYTKLFEDKIRETEFNQMQVVYAHHLSHADLWKNMSFENPSIYRNLLVTFIKSNLKM